MPRTQPSVNLIALTTCTNLKENKLISSKKLMKLRNGTAEAPNSAGEGDRAKKDWEGTRENAFPSLGTFSETGFGRV